MLPTAVMLPAPPCRAPSCTFPCLSAIRRSWKLSRQCYAQGVSRHLKIRLDYRFAGVASHLRIAAMLALFGRADGRYILPLTVHLCKNTKENNKIKSGQRSVSILRQRTSDVVLEGERLAVGISLLSSTLLLAALVKAEKRRRGCVGVGKVISSSGEQAVRMSRVSLGECFGRGHHRWLETVTRSTLILPGHSVSGQF